MEGEGGGDAEGYPADCAACQGDSSLKQVHTVHGFQSELDFNNALCFIESNIVCKEKK